MRKREQTIYQYDELPTDEAKEKARDGSGSFYTIAENIAADITRMFRDHFSGDQYVCYTTPATRAVLHDDQLKETLNAAEATYRGEFGDEEKASPDLAAMWTAYRIACLNRMRVGYSKARRRWEKRGRFAANSQLWAIAEAVDRSLNGDLFEGARFTLRYGYHNQEWFADCEEQTGDY